MDEKNIYIVLTQTGTVMSRLLKSMYHAEYNHASVCLNDDMEPMFSFGRLTPYNAFIGGFVRESVNFGTFKRFSNTQAKILQVKVSAKTYENMASFIEQVESGKGKYSYNYKGLFYAFFGKHREFENRYYCSEFVRAVLMQGGKELCVNLPDIIHPSDFLQVEHTVVYEGLLRNYDKKTEISV